MVLGFLNKVLGLDLKKAFNPDWSVIFWFLVVAFTAMQFKSVVLSVNPPAFLESFVGKSIGLVLTNPFTFISGLINAGLLEVIGTNAPIEALNLVVTLLNIAYWYLVGVYLSQFFPLKK